MEELEHMCVHSCMYVCVLFAQLGVCDWPSEVCLKSSSVALMYQYVKGSNGTGQEAMWRRDRIVCERDFTWATAAGIIKCFSWGWDS